MLRTFASLPVLAALIPLLYAREKLLGPADREAPGLHWTDFIALVLQGMRMKKDKNAVVSNNSFFILFIGCSWRYKLFEMQKI
jgi:hypothetical protein